MAVDLDAFFKNLKGFNTNTNDPIEEAKQTKELFSKNLNDMSEEEKENFYQSEDFKQFGAKAESLTKHSLNYSGRTVQEIFGLGGRTSRYSYNSFRCLDVDHEDYLDIVYMSPVMQQTIEEGEKLLPTFKYLHEDIFMSLYQFNAEVLPPEEMHIESYMNRSILAKLVNTPTYIALRKTCRCDLFNAGIGTEIIGKQAIEILKEELSKIKDLQQKKEALDKLIEQEEQMDSLSESLEELEELIEEMKMQGDEEGLEELQAEYNATQLSLEQGRALANQLAEDCDELVEASDELAENFVTVLDDTITQATSEVQAVSDYVEAWGLGQGPDVRVPFGIKRSVLERIRSSDYLKKFTDMIGKYKECAVTEQKKKAKSGAVEIKSVNVGSKIQDTLPSDRMNLCNETTKKDFYRRMTENQLMTYEKESNKQKNKGPIIICIDQSGSMDGDKEMWAKALAVGILEIAQMQKREFACIPYDSRCRDTIVIHKDEISPEKIIKIAESKASGGTSFEAPLKKASELIDESNFKEADVVFITDGDCYVSDEFRRKFKQLREDKEFRTMGVLVDYGHSSRSSLDDFCDSVTKISKISEASKADSEVNKMIFGTL